MIRRGLTNKEIGRNAGFSNISAEFKLDHPEEGSPGRDFAVQEKPYYDGDGRVCCKLTPYHVDIRRLARSFESSCLLDGLPYCQDSKSYGESCREVCNLEVSQRA